tara:strand:+ start:8954 stop:9679 length:726 start_codon:yes stop_codon:yes gene_type:complete
MNNKSLAQNHLSELAKKGRYGDSDIAKTSKGELWHVNPKEKMLMDMYGMKGEKLVDAMGSGTINPETGLEEKFIDPFTAFQIGMGAYSAVSGFHEQRNLAENEIMLANEGIQAVEESQKLLDKSYGLSTQANVTEYGMEVENLAEATGIQKSDIKKSSSEAVGKANLALSGTLEEKETSLWDKIEKKYSSVKESMLSTLGSKQGTLASNYEREKANLISERKRYENMKRLANQRANQGFFG